MEWSKLESISEEDYQELLNASSELVIIALRCDCNSDDFSKLMDALYSLYFGEGKEYTVVCKKGVIRLRRIDSVVFVDVLPPTGSDWVEG